MPAPILFVHHRSELGGAPASLAYVIEHLDRSRVEPHVYCPPGRAAELFHEAGAVVHTGPVSNFTHIWASTYKGRRWLLLAREVMLLPRHLYSFNRLLRSHRFELVHLNDSPLIPAAYLAHRRGIPIVWHLRSALPALESVRSRFVRRTIRRLATATIAINEDVAASFAIGSEVIPNGLDLERFAPDSGVSMPTLTESHHQAALPLVAYFGFIYPSKGFREFLEAAAMLRRDGVQARFVIVGGAVRSEAYFATRVGRLLQLLDLARNYEQDAHRLAAALGIDDVVEFIPFTQDTDRIYRMSDLVVAPSRGPELGRPVLEAAACGVPVIASGSARGGGIIEPGVTGVLVERDSPRAIAAAITELLRDPQRRAQLGAAARRHAEDRFDIRRNTALVESVYGQIVPRLRGRVPILFVHHRPQLGGAPVSLAQLIAHLDARFEPHVLVPPGPAADLFARSGATVHQSKVAIFSHTWDGPYQGLRWLIVGRELTALPQHVRRLRALMRVHRFPIVHINDSPMLPAAIVARSFGPKIVWHLRSALAAGSGEWRRRMIISTINHHGDVAIAIDRDVASTFAVDLPVRIVPNSAIVSPELDGPSFREQLMIPEERVLVALAGFIRRQKGWPELVEAARIVIDRGLPAHFVVVGGGVRPPAYFRTPSGRALKLLGILKDEESEIAEAVTQSGLSTRFALVPFTPDTGAMYRSSDIVVFPNQGIGLGRPVLEAATYGKPVVAAGSRDGGGVLIPDVTGLLLDRPSPELIADAIERLIVDVDLRRRMGVAAQAHASRTFSAHENARRVGELYDDLLEIGPPTVAARPVLERPRHAVVQG